MRYIHTSDGTAHQLVHCDCCYKVLDIEDAAYRKEWWQPTFTGQFDLCTSCANDKVVRPDMEIRNERASTD